MSIHSIAVLITCHNRKTKTLECLRALFNQNGLGIEFNIEVFLVDDGSTDGTSNAIIAKYPEVSIIQGNGQLYWNRGMYLAWEKAAESKDFDYYMWLNDDTFLVENALAVLFKEQFENVIVCGTTKSQVDNSSTYGAYLNHDKKLIVPDGKFQKSDFCNGNCVLIPRSVFKKIGLLDPVFRHALGDFDYSLRARKIGFDILVAPDYVGFCERHDTVPKWRSNPLPVAERLKNLYSPLSGCHPAEFFIFDKRHNGFFVASFHFLTIHLRCLFPVLYSKY
jgi:GT2 family glycosyltransferase